MYSILVSIKLAGITTFILIILGIFISLWLTFYKTKLKIFVEIILVLPLVLPPSVIGFYLLRFFSTDNFFGKIWYYIFDKTLIFSFTSLVIGSVIYSLPFAVQPIRTAFELIDKQAIETSFTLGIGRIKTFFIIMLPMSINGILSAIILTFMHTIGEFGIILMLGGGINPSTEVISITIFNYVEELRYHEANIASITLLIFSLAMSLILFLIRKNVKR